MAMKIPQPGWLDSFSKDTGTGRLRLDDGTVLHVTATTLGTLHPVPGRRLRVTAVTTLSSDALEAAAVEPWIDEHNRQIGPSREFLDAARAAFDKARQFAEATVPGHFAAAFDGRRPSALAWQWLLAAIGTSAERRAALMAAARPTTRLLARDGRPEPGASKLGGKPDLPRGFRWPEYDGTPHAFLAQLRTDELSTVVREHLHLEPGLLSFFYELESGTWGIEESDLGAMHVAWSPDPIVLVPHEPPGRSQLLPEVALALCDDVTIPSSTEMYFEVPQAELGAWAMSNASLSSAVDLHADRHGTSVGQVGGCARRHQPDPGLPPSVVLLFQLEADEHRSFGDAGQLLVWIEETDLRARRFDRAWHEVESY